jgi:hypothetical protein
MAIRCIRAVLLLGGLIGLAAGCNGGVSNTDAGQGCPASRESGIWLVPFGPVTHDLNLKGSVSLMVAIVQGSEKEGDGKPVAGRTVSFRIINPESDASLDASGAVTDADGLATAIFKAGNRPDLYQVEASTPGTCPRTFTNDVREAPRQLRAVTASPFDTFTKVKVPVVVEALQVTTKGSARLSGEEITFRLGLGKSGETLLFGTDGSGGAPVLKVTTNAAGWATAMVATGSQPIPELQVTASMSGTADAEVKLRIVEGNAKPCQGPADCPLGYTCSASNICEALPPTPPSTGCTSNAQCAPPTICQVSTGKCLQPTGKSCDPVEGLGCDPGDVCVGGQCAKLPASCVDNSNCPPSFVCVNGVCVPGGKPPTGGCVTNKDCPADATCINGQCKPKAACNIPHQPDRLKGTWKYDSTLHLRDAVSPVLKGLLGAAGILRDILEGNFKISGIPSFVTSLVQKYLKKLIQQYVPPWGQQLIVTLGDLNDIVSEMRVLSTVQKNGVGGDAYVNSEQWDLVEFNYKGKKISTPPANIPEIGQVTIPAYTSKEVCGVLFIDKHNIDNVVGGIIKWAIDTALSLVTCNTQGAPCFNSVDEALQQTIDCAMLAAQLEALILSIWSGAPSIAASIEQACNGQKGNLIDTIVKELASITTKLKLLQLSGVVNIPNPGGDSVLQGGKWYGTLGGGNFQGDFSAQKQ